MSFKSIIIAAALIIGSTQMAVGAFAGTKITVDGFDRGAQIQAALAE
jgi:long-subunit fatty acid transport protein